MELAPFVTENGVGKAVNDREKESAGVSRLLNLRVCQVNLQIFDSRFSSKLLLVVSIVFCNIGKNIESRPARIFFGTVVVVSSANDSILLELFLHIHFVVSAVFSLQSLVP